MSDSGGFIALKITSKELTHFFSCSGTFQRAPLAGLKCCCYCYCDLGAWAHKITESWWHQQSEDKKMWTQCKPQGQMGLMEEKECVFVLGVIWHVLRNCILALTMPVKLIYLSINLYLMYLYIYNNSFEVGMVHSTEAYASRSLLSQQWMSDLTLRFQCL